MHSFGSQFSRRSFLRMGVTSGIALAAGMPTLANASTPVRIGFIPERDPATGGAAPDAQYVVEELRTALADGIDIAGTTYPVDIIMAAEGADIDSTVGIAQSLIDQGINLMLCASESQALNEVANICEAANMPCLTFGPPWEVWYFGRGGKAGQPSPFQWTAHIGADIADSSVVSTRAFDKVNSNKKVSVIIEAGPESATVEKFLTGTYAKTGYEVLPFQRYEKGAQDWSENLAHMDKGGADTLIIVMENDDFVKFMPQLKASPLSAKLKVVQVAKTGGFPEDVDSLGASAIGLTILTEWTKGFPYSSPVTGVGSLSLAFGYETATGNQWTSRLGATQGLFDVGIQGLKGAKGLDRESIMTSLVNLKTDTMLGPIDMTSGPVSGAGIVKMVSAQWVEGVDGYYTLDLMVLDNTDHPTLRLEWDMQPFNVVL
ncbi:amino acid/amide ABC transporter substrate-binding protein (HAAT family) [Pacificibacter maritimus]|uniref:Amino acid/amide ABC transporter substrate-binding protein (HAAT family) n=1 Tax=Pacificibacter maritimus TaxID=762213 RepID=A0A3N4USE0_9RHOB|nr:ABC transporter substrate-binding protein [Pacificibacter maritimus]RPE71605.1 amino acid/amide ABC transporter substrate-binding protein (HAAT family) [Pacificibacter maritimus]